MRIDPPGRDIIKEKDEEDLVGAITRRTAIVIAFISVFFFFLKLLFF